MPNKTVYIKETNRDIWERAERLAGGSLSDLLAEALRRIVNEKEGRETENMEEIQVELWNAEEKPYTAEFVGRWLLAPDAENTRTGEPGYDAGLYFGVAETRKGKIAIYTAHCNGGRAPTLETYDSLAEAEEDGYPGDILAMSSEDYVQKLDI